MHLSSSNSRQKSLSSKNALPGFLTKYTKWKKVRSQKRVRQWSYDFGSDEKSAISQAVLSYIDDNEFDTNANPQPDDVTETVVASLITSRDFPVQEARSRKNTGHSFH
jgi:hypothetical protein